MPTPTEILAIVVAKLRYDEKDDVYFEQNFHEVLQALMDEGQHALRTHQKAALKQIIEMSDKIEVSDSELSERTLWKGIASLSNQSRKRAGVHMELSVKWVLNRLNIPNDYGKPITGRSDLICPSMETYHTHPERCVVLEFKRTLRERWKEVIDEISKSGKTVWLLTLDDYISDDLVKSMERGNVTMYVPDSVYARLTQQPGRLRSLDNFITDLTHVVGPNAQRRLT